MQDSGAAPENNRDFVINAVRDAAQRQVEENVYQRIKGDFLKLKFLGGGGALLLLLIVYFHQAIFSYVVSIGGEAFKRDINEQIKAEQALVAEAKAAHNFIQIQISQSLAAMAASSNELAKLNAEFAKQKVELANELVKLDAALKTIRDAKDVIDERVANAQSTAQVAMNQINEKAEQLNALTRTQAAILSDLKGRSLVRPTLVETPTIDQGRSQQSQRPTVYFQFAGFTRERASEISKEIEKDGWAIPGLERTAAAVNTNQIRFNPSDRNEATQLKRAADSALQRLNLNFSLTLEENPTVKRGIIEIWVYLR